MHHKARPPPAHPFRFFTMSKNKTRARGSPRSGTELVRPEPSAVKPKIWIRRRQEHRPRVLDYRRFEAPFQLHRPTGAGARRIGDRIRPLWRPRLLAAGDSGGAKRPAGPPIPRPSPPFAALAPSPCPRVARSYIARVPERRHTAPEQDSDGVRRPGRHHGN